MDLKELFKKYNILTDGLQRRYVINAFERKYDLDYVTPIEIGILVPNEWEETTSDTGIVYKGSYHKVFENRSWVQILKEFLIYLQSKEPKTKEDLIAYRTDWSKAAIFSASKTIDNMVEIEDGLFFSVNYTATHSTWIIGDLLSLYGIKYGYIVVHRTPAAEPKEIREVVGTIRREEFKEYLCQRCGKTEERADKIVKNFEVLNKILNKMGTSYNDFFLFDETLALSNYKAKLLKDLYKYVNWDDKQIKVVQAYLDYLTNFYTKLKKESKGNKEDIEFWIPKF